jgi:Transcription factor WhiB
MTHRPPPVSSKYVPCQRDPEGWFTRGCRADTRAACFTCPVRPWCADQALRWRASWGVWAGVWIDGRHDDAVPYLRAIAANQPSPPQPPPGIAGRAIRPQPSTSTPLRRPAAPASGPSMSTTVLARSSGHCEIVAEGCRYSFDRLMSRHRTGSTIEKPSAADVFAACTICAEMLAGLEPQLGTRWGYGIEPGRDRTLVPFRWRGSRWVLLGRDGWLTELSQTVRSA